MSSPRILTLILFSILAATTVGTANNGNNNDPVPQRLRVRVEKQRLPTGGTTKVIIEFLNRDYAEVVNDATRVITLGTASSGSRMSSSGSGDFNPKTIEVKPGAQSGEAFFTSNGAGRLYITATSEGLESGQALVLISDRASASLLSQFVSLFETVAHAQDDTGFEITPKTRKATANGEHRANFNVSFLDSPPAGTIVRITTNVTDGGILYKGQKVGGNVADIKLDDGDGDISGEISVYSKQAGTFHVTASVRPDGPTDQASVEFTRPRPAQIIFDANPMTIGTDPTNILLTVRFADAGGFATEPDQERRVHFQCATEGDQVSFRPASVTLAPGRASAQVVFRLQQLPPSNELKLLATTDPGIDAGQKNLIIKSAIEKILIEGPNKLETGGNEGEYSISLVDKDGKRVAADWNRQIDLNVTGGTLSVPQLVMPKGARKAVFRYTSRDAGKDVLTASSTGIDDGTLSIGVVHPVYWLAMFALFGGALGGVARELDRHKTIGRLLPRRHHKRLDTRLINRLVCSLIGALFLYLLYKLGLQQILGGPALPVAVDPEVTTVAFFLGGFGGFAGTLVLTLGTKVFVWHQRRQPAPAHVN